mgnify:CR=1 FL=1
MSATRKGGLGRGLAALIPTGPPVTAPATTAPTSTTTTSTTTESTTSAVTRFRELRDQFSRGTSFETTFTTPPDERPNSGANELLTT